MYRDIYLLTSCQEMVIHNENCSKSDIAKTKETSVSAL